MTDEITARIRDQILARVPGDGTTIGNISLARSVCEAIEVDGNSFDEAAVNAVREQLLKEGVLGKGRGRGDSVYRKQAAAPNADSDDDTAENGADRIADREVGPDTVESPYGSYRHAV